MTRKAVFLAYLSVMRNITRGMLMTCPFLIQTQNTNDDHRHFVSAVVTFPFINSGSE